MKHHPAIKRPSRPHFKRAPRLAAALWALCLAHSAPAQPSPAAPVPRPGEELFSDDFERQDLGEWRAMVPSFTIIDGALRGQQSPGAHGAVGQVRRPMRDVVVSFRFKLDGSTTFNAVFDDKDFKGSHGGHICRVLFTTNQIRLGDDKEGVMRNDIFEMTKKPWAKHWRPRFSPSGDRLHRPGSSKTSGIMRQSRSPATTCACGSMAPRADISSRRASPTKPKAASTSP
jgi:hypothetical protein